MLSAAQHAHLNAYVREIGDRLRLRDWNISLNHDAADGEYAGQSQSTFGRKSLTVWLNPGGVLNPPEFRQTVVHELLHAHFNEMRDLFYRVYDGEPTDDVPGVFYRMFKERWEVCLDTVADVIAESFPLMEPLPAEPGHSERVNP